MRKKAFTFPFVSDAHTLAFFFFLFEREAIVLLILFFRELKLFLFYLFISLKRNGKMFVHGKGVY